MTNWIIKNNGIYYIDKLNQVERELRLDISTNESSMLSQ